MLTWRSIPSIFSGMIHLFNSPIWSLRPLRAIALVPNGLDLSVSRPVELASGRKFQSHRQAAAVSNDLPLKNRLETMPSTAVAEHSARSGYGRYGHKQS